MWKTLVRAREKATLKHRNGYAAHDQELDEEDDEACLLTNSQHNWLLEEQQPEEDLETSLHFQNKAADVAVAATPRNEQKPISTDPNNTLCSPTSVLEGPFPTITSNFFEFEAEKQQPQQQDDDGDDAASFHPFEFLEEDHAVPTMPDTSHISHHMSENKEAYFMSSLVLSCDTSDDDDDDDGEGTKRQGDNENYENNQGDVNDRIAHEYEDNDQHEGHDHDGADNGNDNTRDGLKDMELLPQLMNTTRQIIGDDSSVDVDYFMDALEHHSPSGSTRGSVEYINANEQDRNNDNVIDSVLPTSSSSAVVDNSSALLFAAWHAEEKRDEASTYVVSRTEYTVLRNQQPKQTPLVVQHGAPFGQVNNADEEVGDIASMQDNTSNDNSSDSKYSNSSLQADMASGTEAFLESWKHEHVSRPSDNDGGLHNEQEKAESNIQTDGPVSQYLDYPFELLSAMMTHEQYQLARKLFNTYCIDCGGCVRHCICSQNQQQEERNEQQIDQPGGMDQKVRDLSEDKRNTTRTLATVAPAFSVKIQSQLVRRPRSQLPAALVALHRSSHNKTLETYHIPQQHPTTVVPQFAWASPESASTTSVVGAQSFLSTYLSSVVVEHSVESDLPDETHQRGVEDDLVGSMQRSRERNAVGDTSYGNHDYDKQASTKKNNWWSSKVHKGPSPGYYRQLSSSDCGDA